MKQKSILVLLSLALTGIVYSQNKILIGKVINEDGNPVPYASITIRHSYEGASSDKDGNFKLEYTKADTVICTHVNYETKKVLITATTTTITFLLARYVPKLTTVYISAEVDGRHKQETQLKSQQDTSRRKNQREDDEMKIFTKVEVQATFGRGEEALWYYLNKNIVYPDTASTAYLDDLVTVRFTIDKEGKAKNVEILKGIDNNADSAVIRAIEKMHRWNPAIQNGRYVDSYRELSVHFFVEPRHYVQ